MALDFDNSQRIPITRALLCPHIATDEEGRRIGRTLPIVDGPMDVSHLLVDIDRDVDRRVSLMATTEDDDLDPYGIEIELEPKAARHLARQLLAAADAFEAS